MRDLMKKVPEAKNEIDVSTMFVLLLHVANEKSIIYQMLYIF
jgi:hypothetical protein